MEQTYVERASGKANGIHARVARARSSKTPSHEVPRRNESHWLSAAEKFAPSQILHLQRTLGNRAAGRLIQAKLNTSHPDDPYEPEADRVADTIKRMTEPAATEEEGPQVQAKPLVQLRRMPVAVREDGEEERASSTPSVQLLCADCEDEKAHPKPFDNKLIGPLSSPERAFTDGVDSYFGHGQYTPATSTGRRLIAREDDSVIRRAPVPADFRITGIDPSPDPTKVFFDYTSDAIHATQAPKVKALASPVGRALTLNGYASEEEPAAVPDIVDRRMKAVSKELKKQGHTGDRKEVPNAARSLGNQDYRSMRMVEVLPSIVTPPSGKGKAPVVTPATPTVDPCTAPAAENAVCPAQFAPALAAAKAEIADAYTKITGKTAAATANMTRFFPGVPVPTIEANVKALKDVVGDTSKHMACHSACDRNCNRSGYWQRPSPAFPIGALIICPKFKTAAADFRIYMILHESAHGTPVIGAEDTAYYFSRQIEALTPAFSVKNTDSYILTVRLTHSPKAMTVGPATPDKLTGMSGPEETMAKRALAFLESWLNYCSFTANSLYAAANRALTGGAWPAADSWAPPLIHSLAAPGVFGGDIGDPGTAAPLKIPTRDDMERVAGMRERYSQMYSVLSQQVVNVSKGAPGKDSWGGATTGTGIATLNQTAVVGPAFFAPALGDVGRTKYLIRLMGAQLGISAPYQTKYANAADVIRKASKVAP